MATDISKIEWQITVRDNATGVFKGIETSFGRLQNSYRQLVGVLGLGGALGAASVFLQNVMSASMEAETATLRLKCR